MNGKKRKTRARVAWVLPLALLALPNCSFNEPTVGPGTRVPVGTTLVDCDIHPSLPERTCATDADVAMGVRLADAAVALVQGDDGKFLGIDDSPAAQARCGQKGEVITFQGEFPAGQQVCVDPAKIGPGLVYIPGQQYGTSSDVCADRCLDLVSAGDPPDPLVLAFCQERARASTNVPADPNGPFGGACTSAGMPIDTFADPRLAGEPVDWVNLEGVVASGGNLTRNKPCDPTSGCLFDSGAASAKAATSGDGYLEFSVSELDTNRITGLTTGQGADDHDNAFQSIGFALDFFRDGCIYLYENGAPRVPPTPVAANGCVLPANTWGNYAPGDRFRITFHDNFDGSAAIEYGKLQGACTPGSTCPALTFFTSPVHGAYPLHVDAAFIDPQGALLDVRLVYIH
jgi:hypothetical protein